MASGSVDIMNQKISIVQGKLLKFPKELEDNLKSGAKAFKAKSFMMAAKYFNNFLEAKNSDGKYLNSNDEAVVVVSYMYCLCCIESSNSKNLWDALELLEKVVKRHGSRYPMFYYAIGKAYFKLYRFSKASEVVSKCLELFRDPNAVFVNSCIPETEEIIPESTKKGLLTALINLNQQCSSWHRPNAVCCLAECSNYSSHEAADKNIFFASPTFVGMVQVTCNNPCNYCTMRFHVACWKAKKESLCSTGKLCDRDVLHMECFTPNCVDGKGVRSIIKKVEVFNDEAVIKATREIQEDDPVKYVKPAATPKGAIKKQQNQPKPKNLSEPRTPGLQNPKPPSAKKEIMKVETTEEEDAFQEEQTIKAAVNKLSDLRAKNFGISDEKIWRPSLSMYGNAFMLATAEGLPDPDFSNDSAHDEEKAFVFSYFFEFLSKNGPMELSRLDEKWKETQANVFGKTCESITTHHVDLADFLTQSLKFAVVGDYICTADRLPEAYHSAKSDACQILKFFMETDADENSTASSLDDEAAYNDFINQKQNNYSMSNSTITNDAQSANEETNFVGDELTINGTKNNASEYVNGHVGTEKSEEPEESPEVDEIVAFPSKTPTTGSSPDAEMSEEAETIGNLTDTEESETLTEKSARKSSNSPELMENNSRPGSVENNDAETQKEETIEQKHARKRCHSPTATIMGAYSVHDLENRLKRTQPESELDESPKETGLTDDFENRSPTIENARKTSDTPCHNDNSEKKLTNGKETESFSSVDVTDTLDRSKAIPAKSNVVPEPRNDPDNSALISEIQRLNEELTKSKQEKTHLEGELRAWNENFRVVVGNMAMEILNKQYEANRCHLIAALNELNSEYKLVMDIQKLLHSSIGQTLPIPESEFVKNIAEVEKLVNIHQVKYTELRDKLSSNLVEGNHCAIELPPEQLPNIAKRNLSDDLQSAFGMYRMHHFRELQSLQMRPGQSTFMAPPPPTRYSFPPPDIKNIPQRFPHQPPLNFIPPGNTQLVRHVQQYNGHAYLGAPLLPTGYAHDPRQGRSRPLPFIPPHSIPQKPPPFPKPRPATANYLENPLAAEQPELPVVSATQPTNQINGFSSKRSSIASPINESNGEQPIATVLQELEDLSKKSMVHGSHEKIPPATPEPSLPLGNPPKTTNKSNYSSKEIAPSTDFKSTRNIAEKIQQPEPPARKTPGHSLDRLMRRLRTLYAGVLELDLLKSIELVRKGHNNSLSKLPIRQIIREADNFIGIIQQKQLCGYVKYQPTQNSAGRNSSTALHQSENTSTGSSSPSANAWKKETTVFSKKKWEPVNIPNDTWSKDPFADTECAFCIETISSDDSHTLECKHSFHKQCIRDWQKFLVNSKAVVGSCPLCRHSSAIDTEYPPLPLG